MPNYQLILMRHGESEWNLQNRFTGWTDVELTPQGEAEARLAGRLLQQHQLLPDIAFTSVLKRAIKTLWLCLETIERPWLPTIADWRLNERHYGALQGLNKKETAQKFGDEQVLLWRRSYDTQPPALADDDPRSQLPWAAYPDLAKTDAPRTECLKDTVERVTPYFQSTIAPHLLQGKRVLIAAHGNSLRALVKHLDNISDSEIVHLNIPNGTPLVYELNANLTPIRHYYLGDPV